MYEGVYRFAAGGGGSHSLWLSARRDLSQLSPGVVRRVDAVQTHVHGQHVEQLIWKGGGKKNNTL